MLDDRNIRFALLARCALFACCMAFVGCATPVVVPQDGWRFATASTDVIADHGMVVSADPFASHVGLAVLEGGGNAVDAAVATSFALAVTYPRAGNIGGGGFMVLRLSDGTRGALDYREIAPAGATRDMYLDPDGSLSDRATVGALAAGVPGTVMGLWDAHQRYGSLPWADLVAPAISLAEGFEAHQSLHESVTKALERIEESDPERALTPERQALLRGSLRSFLPAGSPPEVGKIFRQPELAATLRRIAADGTDGFYRGETADMIVAEMEATGGIITRDDLANYRALWRDPIEFDYRDYRVISMPPISSGGATLAELANILEGYDLANLPFDSAERIHLLAEAMKRAFADRNAYLGDPAFVELPIERMTSDAYAVERRADIALDRATPSTNVGPALDPVTHGADTTHYSIVDSAGNAVSVTTTINGSFGCKQAVREAGFVLNNEMDDFAARPGYPNSYGLVQGENNAIAPGKRMLSSMTPTIVEAPDGRLLLVTGSPGGARIITAVFQMVSNVVDHGMSVRDAVNAPRMHHQHLPDQITVESGGFSDATLAALEVRGHTIDRLDMEPGRGIGNVQSILILPDGRLAGAADPRRHGLTVGY